MFCDLRSAPEKAGVDPIIVRWGWRGAVRGEPGCFKPGSDTIIEYSPRANPTPRAVGEVSGSMGCSLLSPYHISPSHTLASAL